VEVSSLGEGKGATFTIKLPLETTQPEIPSPTFPTSPTSYPSLAGVRVLIVDDEPDLRQLFEILLEDLGVQVTQATSAQEALSILKAHPGGYDVLLSDIGLPGEDGYALIRQVRALSAEEGGQIPAAAISGYTGDVQQTESLAAGFQLHIKKPVEPDQLVSVVAELAGRSVTGDR
jgi:two-component system CheB/CheR fusion protein